MTFSSPPPAQPLALLGGLSPQAFMQRYWQKKPLLIRQAIAGMQPPLPHQALFSLAKREDVESRLVQRKAGASGLKEWTLKHGPFMQLPSPASKNWTILVQGVDMHNDNVHQLLQRFRFVPDARLDDVMISYASDGAGVGPHVDRYDVFLLQTQGRRRWRIGKQKDLRFVLGLPLRILESFIPQQEYLLEPGDMLYLPPLWAHDGVAVGRDCMTCSIGFRQPTQHALGTSLLEAALEDLDDAVMHDQTDHPYTDAGQPAVAQPARIPQTLQSFAQHTAQQLARQLTHIQHVQRTLGESLTRPKPLVQFEVRIRMPTQWQRLELDAKTRMLYDSHHIYANGMAWRASGVEARLLRKLANRHRLMRQEVEAAPASLQALLREWVNSGWLHATGTSAQ